MNEIKKLESGSHREDKNGKGRFDLLPPKALTRVAKRLEMGAKKYGARDWGKGIPEEMLVDSCLRHIFQHMEGKKDEDHIAAAVTNLLQLMEQDDK
jgi:hypothetical protein